ncbi:tail assembly chaperone [Gordonia phage Jumbo]|uniref:Tail assembly chaperone n=1 Tax=Gordonia phage Jumbo TaxID=1887650 RepID=A0A1B3B0Q1_9CAUD|nr:tail assembly chaperone [Gordonia phage Jumbo]AOE44610.1 tail assembly chaperone [Gordonia phage Jumbo]
MSLPTENTVTDPTSFDYGKTPEEIAADQHAASQGIPQTRHVFMDYWGKDVTEKFYFPGQEGLPEEYKQYIEFKPMNEGARARFQKKTNRGVVIESRTQNARMSMDPASDRRALFEESVIDWRLARNGTLMNFSHHEFMRWVETANPKIIDELETAIRKSNEWMISELSSEAIREEIENLEDRYKEAVKREEAEGNFGVKRDNS